MITVDVQNRWTGRLKRRYLCKSMRPVDRLKRKYRFKFWYVLNVDDYDWGGPDE
jgi:hypothetical protein